jgi:hypothetical protein
MKFTIIQKMNIVTVCIISMFNVSLAENSTALIKQLMQSSPGDFIIPETELPAWDELQSAAQNWQPDSSPEVDVWHRDTIMCADTVSRPFHYRLPAEYKFETATPLVLYLHGGVSRAELPDSGGESDFPEGFMTRWASDAGYIIVVPSAQLGATWWDALGCEYLLEILRKLKSNLNVQDNRVYVTGFSDGGSGSWFLAQFYPTDFAAFLPQCGHPGCDNWGNPPRQAYFRNLVNRPLYAINNGKDALYPAAKIQEMLIPAWHAGADLQFYVYPEYPHSPDYWNEEKIRLGSFLSRTSRNPQPTRIILEAADPVICDWLEIEEISAGQQFPGKFDDYNSRTSNERVVVGFMPDPEYSGKACRVNSISKAGDYPAIRIGLMANDLIIGLGQDKIKSYADFREAIAKFKCDDEFDLTIKRNGKKLTLAGQFNSAQYGWLHDRSKPSMQLEAFLSANRYDLHASRAGKINLYIDPLLIDIEQSVSVYLDNHLIYDAKIDPDPKLMLQLLDQNRDPQRMYIQKIEIDLEKSHQW